MNSLWVSPFLRADWQSDEKKAHIFPFFLTAFFLSTLSVFIIYALWVSVSIFGFSHKSQEFIWKKNLFFTSKASLLAATAYILSLSHKQ